MSFLRFRPGVFLSFLFALTLGLGAQDTTVVLLRHAERQSLFDGDSPLAAEGRHRALALVPQLEGFRPSVLYVSDLQRTGQTLAPLAAKLGLAPRVRAKGASEALATEVLREHRGGTVLICWHHDLMKRLVRGLGVKGPVPYWSLDSYDRLWLVRIPARGEITFEERRQSPPAVAAGAQGR
jgi:broad specificity phosphatase PhoE